MEPKERILEIQEITGMSGRALATYIGVKEHEIKAIRVGKVQKISQRIADAVVEKFPQFSKLWIMTGEGEKYVGEPSSTEKTTDYDARINELLAICAMQEKTIKTLNEELTSMSQDVRSLVSCVRDLLTERVQRAYPTIASEADRHLNDKA